MAQQIRIGHYILGKTIGSGGFAKVKTARHDLTGLDVAVKIINKKKMKNKNMISKVKRQIKILKFINHPNIIKLYEVLDTTNDIFVITELARKGQLYDNIQAKLTQSEARFYFKQIINGVDYIHRNHICHRDLKPENILIDENNLIKIGDFGLSNLMKDGKPLKTSCGSPFYAAPEIVYNRKYEGTSVDIWSSGVILYALIVGCLPFEDDNITLLYKKIDKGAYTIPNTVNKYAQDLIRRMLEVDPSLRISIPQVKAHPWMQNTIPLYMKIPDQFIIEREGEPEIDEQVLERIKQLDLNFHEYTDDKIRKTILKRDDESFAIAYELLKSQKDRRIYVQDREFTQQYMQSTILSKVENTNMRPELLEETDDKFVYGKVYEMHAKMLAEKLIQALISMGIEYEIKNGQYCFKCVYLNKKVKKSHTVMTMIDEADENEDGVGGAEYSKKENKFTKSVIKFTAQIFQVNRKSLIHVLDLHLTQGHTFVFFPLAAKLYEAISRN